MGNTPSTPEEMLEDKIDYVFDHFKCSRETPPDAAKSVATWNALGWRVFFHNAGMTEDYALSPHALAKAYLALSAAVTSATAAADGKVHLTNAGRELCVGVQLPIIFEDGIMPFVQHLAELTARAQKTPGFESRASVWMPFGCTREYATFLQDRLGTHTFKLKDDDTLFKWLDYEVTGSSMRFRQRNVRLDQGAALHASAFSVGRSGGGLVLAAEVHPERDVYRDFFMAGGPATSAMSYGQRAAVATLQSALAPGEGNGNGSVGGSGRGVLSGRVPCKYMRVNDRMTRVAEVVVNAMGDASGPATGIVTDPRLASFCGSGTFATVIELPYANPGGFTEKNMVAMFVLPAVNISLGAVLNALKAEPLR